MHQATVSHLTREELVAALCSLPAPPTDHGRVELVVIRPETGLRLTPDCAQLTPEEGVRGDRWRLLSENSLESQVTLIRADAARVFTNGQPLALPGDNLLVDLDLHENNLPAGTRLRIGTALCEVTPKPHTGCAKFAGRFGAEARAITADPEFVEWRLRGLHVRVIEAGEVRPGDAIEVLSRP
jgi:hypothetical protein